MRRCDAGVLLSRALLVFGAALIWPGIGHDKIFAAPALPAGFVDDNGFVCVEMRAPEGGVCMLLPVDGTWSWSCQEIMVKAAGVPSLLPVEGCLRSLPKEAFIPPPLGGVDVGNCQEALLPDKVCELDFGKNGYAWLCKNLDSPVEEPFPSPLCMRNDRGVRINEAVAARLARAQEQRGEALRQQARSREKVCIRYEDACYRIFPVILPPQTRPPRESLRAGRAPKYAREQMRACRTENLQRKRICVLEVARSDFPEVDRSGDPRRSGGRKTVRQEHDCVRYENACFMYYLSLTEINRHGKPEPGWSWHLRQRNCSREKAGSGAADAPMVCVSWYRDENKTE